MNQLDYNQSKKSEKKNTKCWNTPNFLIFHTHLFCIRLDLMLPSEISSQVSSQVKSWVIFNPSKRMYFTAFGYMKVYKLVKMKSPRSWCMILESIMHALSCWSWPYYLPYISNMSIRDVNRSYGGRTMMYLDLSFIGSIQMQIPVQMCWIWIQLQLKTGDLVPEMNYKQDVGLK